MTVNCIRYTADITDNRPVQGLAETLQKGFGVTRIEPVRLLSRIIANQTPPSVLGWCIRALLAFKDGSLLTPPPLLAGQIGVVKDRSESSPHSTGNSDFLLSALVPALWQQSRTSIPQRLWSLFNSNPRSGQHLELHRGVPVASTVKEYSVPRWGDGTYEERSLSDYASVPYIMRQLPTVNSCYDISISVLGISLTEDTLVIHTDRKDDLLPLATNVIPSEWDIISVDVSTAGPMLRLTIPGLSGHIPDSAIGNYFIAYAFSRSGTEYGTTSNPATAISSEQCSYDAYSYWGYNVSDTAQGDARGLAVTEFQRVYSEHPDHKGCLGDDPLQYTDRRGKCRVVSVCDRVQSRLSSNV